MRIQQLAIYLYRCIAEEITCVNGLRPLLFVVHFLEHCSGCFRTTGTRYITDLIHVRQRILCLAHIVDEIGSGFHVLRVLRNNPTVEPYVRAFLRNDIIQHHTHLGCLFDSELRITRPTEVEPCLAFRHLFLTEIDFPSADLLLGLQ